MLVTCQTDAPFLGLEVEVAETAVEVSLDRTLPGRDEYTGFL